jgi:hypothetical protein
VATALPCLWTFLLLPRVTPSSDYFGAPLEIFIGADRFDRSLALSRDKEFELTIYENRSLCYPPDYGKSPSEFVQSRAREYG